MPKPLTQLAQHFVFLKALAEFLRGTSLDGIATTECKVLKLPFNRRMTFDAGLFVSPVPEEIVPRGSAGDVITYRAAVTIVSAPTDGELSEEDEINRVLLWRENLYAYLLPLTDTPLPGCPWLRDLNVQPGPLFDVQGFAAMFDVSQVIVTGETVVMRGSENSE